MAFPLPVVAIPKYWPDSLLMMNLEPMFDRLSPYCVVASACSKDLIVLFMLSAPLVACVVRLSAPIA